MRPIKNKKTPVDRCTSAPLFPEEQQPTDEITKSLCRK
jgi:hypothetical protein